MGKVYVQTDEDGKKTYTTGPRALKKKHTIVRRGKPVRGEPTPVRVEGEYTKVEDAAAARSRAASSEELHNVRAVRTAKDRYVLVGRYTGDPSRITTARSESQERQVTPMKDAPKVSIPEKVDVPVDTSPVHQGTVTTRIAQPLYSFSDKPGPGPDALVMEAKTKSDGSVNQVGAFTSSFKDWVFTGPERVLSQDVSSAPVMSPQTYAADYAKAFQEEPGKVAGQTAGLGVGAWLMFGAPGAGKVAKFTKLDKVAGWVSGKVGKTPPVKEYDVTYWKGTAKFERGATPQGSGYYVEHVTKPKAGVRTIPMEEVKRLSKYEQETIVKATLTKDVDYTAGTTVKNIMNTKRVKGQPPEIPELVDVLEVGRMKRFAATGDQGIYAGQIKESVRVPISFAEDKPFKVVRYRGKPTGKAKPLYEPKAVASDDVHKALAGTSGKSPVGTATRTKRIAASEVPVSSRKVYDPTDYVRSMGAGSSRVLSGMRDSGLSVEVRSPAKLKLGGRGQGVRMELEDILVGTRASDRAKEKTVAEQAYASLHRIGSETRVQTEQKRRTGTSPRLISANLEEIAISERMAQRQTDALAQAQLTGTRPRVGRPSPTTSRTLFNPKTFTPKGLGLPGFLGDGPKRRKLPRKKKPYAWEYINPVQDPFTFFVGKKPKKPKDIKGGRR